MLSNILWRGKWPFKKQNYLFLFNVYRCFACMCLYTTFTQGPRRPEEDVRSLGTRVTDSCELPRVCWEMNPGPLLSTMSTAPRRKCYSTEGTSLQNGRKVESPPPKVHKLKTSKGDVEILKQFSDFWRVMVNSTRGLIFESPALFWW